MKKNYMLSFLLCFLTSVHAAEKFTLKKDIQLCTKDSDVLLKVTGFYKNGVTSDIEKHGSTCVNFPIVYGYKKHLLEKLEIEAKAKKKSTHFAFRLDDLKTPLMTYEEYALSYNNKHTRIDIKNPDKIDSKKTIREDDIRICNMNPLAFTKVILNYGSKIQDTKTFKGSHCFQVPWEYVLRKYKLTKIEVETSKGSEKIRHFIINTKQGKSLPTTANKQYQISYDKQHAFINIIDDSSPLLNNDIKVCNPSPVHSIKYTETYFNGMQYQKTLEATACSSVPWVDMNANKNNAKNNQLEKILVETQSPKGSNHFAIDMNKRASMQTTTNNQYKITHDEESFVIHISDPYQIDLSNQSNIKVCAKEHLISTRAIAFYTNGFWGYREFKGKSCASMPWEYDSGITNRLTKIEVNAKTIFDTNNHFVIDIHGHTIPSTKNKQYEISNDKQFTTINVLELYTKESLAAEIKIDGCSKITQHGYNQSVACKTDFTPSLDFNIILKNTNIFYEGIQNNTIPWPTKMFLHADHFHPNARNVPKWLRPKWQHIRYYLKSSGKFRSVGLTWFPRYHIICPVFYQKNSIIYALCPYKGKTSVLYSIGHRNKMQDMLKKNQSVTYVFSKFDGSKCKKGLLLNDRGHLQCK